MVLSLKSVLIVILVSSVKRIFVVLLLRMIVVVDVVSFDVRI